MGHRQSRWAEEEGDRKSTGEVKTGVFGGHPGFMKLTRRMIELVESCEGHIDYGGHTKEEEELKEQASRRNGRKMKKG